MLSACSDSDQPASPLSGEDAGDPSSRIFFMSKPFAASDEAAQNSIELPGMTTLENLKEFDVWAVMRDWPHTKYMSDVTVSKQPNGSWDYSPHRYWPVQPLAFFGYSPIDFGKNNYVKSVDTDASGRLVLRYEASHPYYDLVTASTVAENGQVKMEFAHTLSAVVFRFYCTNTNIKVWIGGLQLDNFASGGTLTCDMWGNRYWGNYTPHNAFIYLMNGEVLTNTYHNGELTSIPDWFEPSYRGRTPFYYIPQWLAWNLQLRVGLKIFDRRTGNILYPNPPKNEDGKEYFGVQTINVYGEGGVTEWKPGHVYIYDILINSADGMQGIGLGDVTVDDVASYKKSPASKPLREAIKVSCTVKEIK